MRHKPTSKEFKNKWFKDNCWDWRNSGIHAYNVLKREEEKLNKITKIDNWSKFDQWTKK